MSQPPKNYRWWQEHGAGWAEEVLARKARMPIYHLQEIFLQEYFSRAAPAKVLEFGCGFGRHLEYLRRIPKLDVYGFDQSETMVGEMRWARKPWREKHIQLGEPLKSLPYEDGAFDVVFTVSVLIHVRPEDLDAVLGELWRVSRGHLIHIENIETDDTRVTSEEHDGCWAHDLRAAYARVAPGAALEVAPSMFDIEDVYRVSAPEVELPPMVTKWRAARFRALDDTLSGEINRLRQSASQLDSLRSESDSLRQKLTSTLDRSREADANRATLLQRAKDAEAGQESLRARAREGEKKLQERSDQIKMLIDRVERLESELEKRTSQVGEQTERAKGAEAVRGELLERARSAETRLAEALERARDTDARRASELARAKEGDVVRAALLVRARDAESRIEALLGRAKNAEGQVSDLEERIRITLERARSAEQEVTGLRERAVSAEQKTDSLRQEVEEARAVISRKEESLSGLLKDLDSLRSRSKAAEEQLEPLRSRARDAEEGLAAMQIRAREAEASRTSLPEALQSARAVGVEERDRFEAELAEWAERASDLNSRLDDARAEQDAIRRKLGAARENEASAIARVDELLAQMEVEVLRGDTLAEGLMRAHHVQERVVEQERIAQSRLIALRRRAERAEKTIVSLRARAVDSESRVDQMRDRASTAAEKAETQRLRARKAEAEIVDLLDEVGRLQRECALDRRRADSALGSIDEARSEQARVEAELAALRTMLSSMLNT